MTHCKTPVVFLFLHAGELVFKTLPENFMPDWRSVLFTQEPRLVFNFWAGQGATYQTKKIQVKRCFQVNLKYNYFSLLFILDRKKSPKMTPKSPEIVAKKSVKYSKKVLKLSSKGPKLFQKSPKFFLKKVSS